MAQIELNLIMRRGPGLREINPPILFLTDERKGEAA
jgi:hypothetical protein